LASNVRFVHLKIPICRLTLLVKVIGIKKSVPVASPSLVTMMPRDLMPNFEKFGFRVAHRTSQEVAGQLDTTAYASSVWRV